MKRPVAIAILTLAALLACSMFLLPEVPTPNPGDSTARAVVSSAQAQQSGVIRPGPAQVATAAFPARAALPPPGSALAPIFDQLRTRADNGDALAACRLAVELLECEQLQHLLARDTETGASKAEKFMVDQGNVRGANAVAKMQLRQLQGHTKCEGISADQRALGTGYLRQAAESGINEAMVRYADGQAFGAVDSAFGVIRHPEFDRWRRDAPRFMDRALRQGEPAAVLILSLAYADDNSLFAALVPDDPEAEQAYRLLLRHLRGQSSAVPSDLDPASLARANARSHELHRTFFHGRQVPPPISLNAALTPMWSHSGDQPERSPCE